MKVSKSPYKFDGDDTGKLLLEKPLYLECKTIKSEQYDAFDYATPEFGGHDAFNKVWNILSGPIGICMIVFSELETEVEDNVHNLISDCSNQQGRTITRDMSYIQKVNLYIDYLRSFPPSVISDAVTYKKEVEQLKKHLYRAGELRNIIAHAKWPSITKDGYVFSTVEAINIAVNIPEYKYFRLNIDALENTRAYISAVGNFPYFMSEKYNLL